MKKKVIICLSASANKGKTSSINEVYNLLNGDKTIVRKNTIGDISAIIKLTEKEVTKLKEITKSKEVTKLTEKEIIKSKEIIIGCSSLGDPGSSHIKWLEELIINYQCDIIVTASRSQGNTLENVEKVADNYGYFLMQISPLYLSKSDYKKDVYNVYKLFATKNAQEIIDLIDRFIKNKL